MTSTQASNCFTLAHILREHVTDEEYNWNLPRPTAWGCCALGHARAHPRAFHSNPENARNLCGELVAHHVFFGAHGNTRRNAATQLCAIARAEGWKDGGWEA